MDNKSGHGNKQTKQGELTNLRLVATDKPELGQKKATKGYALSGVQREGDKRVWKERNRVRETVN
jgi:hypothetical protein